MYKETYGIAAIVIVIGVVIFNLLAKKKAGKDRVYSISFTILFFVGAALYFFAIDFNQDARLIFSPFFVIINCIFDSTSAFFGRFNSSSHFSNLAKENPVFHAAVLIHFFAAMYMTLLIVVKLFGKKILNEIRTWRISLGEKYIIIGSDGQAKIFLGNLSRIQRLRTIVIIQSSQIDKKWELIDKGYSVVMLKVGKGRKDNIPYNVYREALIKAGAMHCAHETRVVSMSDDDEINLLIAKIMADFIIKKINPQMKNGSIFLTEEQEKETLEMKLEVRIMFNILERVEHYTFMENTLGKLMFFNPYILSAHKFWWENPITKLIPASWIDTNKAKLKQNANSEKGEFKISTIFIGFDSISKAILKTSIINNQLHNVDYNALVICQNAVKQEKIFKNSAIGLFDETDKDNNITRRGAEIKPNHDGTVYLKNPRERNIIRFKDADALTFELYDHVIKEIDGNRADSGAGSAPSCDYATVIIALGDDKLSIETAMELRHKLYEADLLTGKDGDIEYQRVRIFVKINENTLITDEELLNYNADEIKCRIVTCCVDKEVLSEEYIINEKLDILAKNIANRYDGNVEKTTAVNEWNTCTQHKRESNRYAAAAIQVKLNLLGFDLVKNKKPERDYTEMFFERYGTNTAFDLRAKRKKLEKEIELARNNEKNGQSIPEKILNLKIDEETIHLAQRSSNEFTDTARNNLTELEHQRWNAFYLANDWTKLPIEKIGVGSPGRQNGIAKQHACITTFQGLIDLMNIQKNADKKEIEKNNKRQYIEAESLLRADTIRHDFSTMDFLLDLSDENLRKMREAEGNPAKEYTGILTGSGFYIDTFKA